MQNYLKLVPKNLFDILINTNLTSYKCLVYPIEITYYTDNSKKYTRDSINELLTTTYNNFDKYLKGVAEDKESPTKIIDFFKNRVGDTFINAGIGIKIQQLQRIGIKYKNFFKNKNEESSSDTKKKSPKKTSPKKKTTSKKKFYDFSYD